MIGTQSLRGESHYAGLPHRDCSVALSLRTVCLTTIRGSAPPPPAEEWARAQPRPTWFPWAFASLGITASSAKPDCTVTAEAPPPPDNRLRRLLTRHELIADPKAAARLTNALCGKQTRWGEAAAEPTFAAAAKPGGAELV